MATKQTECRFLLGTEEIDRTSEQVSAFLSQLKLERREVMRIRLNVENILLSWQDRFGREAEVGMACYVSLGQPLIRLRLEGEAFDPLESDEDEFGRWKNALLSRMETQAAYAYTRGVNTVTFHVVKPKRSPLVLLLLSWQRRWRWVWQVDCCPRACGK